jgi:MarR family transcriptional regulator, organic hydroperoxide resistance regulator
MATTSVTAPPDLDQFIDELRALFAAVRQARSRAAKGLEAELTLSQHDMLLALGDRGGLRVGELAEAAAVAPPTATRMLDGLERAGIVERGPAGDDRRAVVVCLTDEGRRLLARKRRKVAARLGGVFGAMDASERENAQRLLRNLTEAIEEL